jgi:uncharacterized protein
VDFSFIDIIMFLAAGLAGGFMSGLLGIGGGIIFIPILDFVFKRYGIHDDEAVKFILANSLFIIVFTGIGNSYKQNSAKNFFPRQILYTALPAIVSALFLTYIIESGTWYNKQKFSTVFLCLLGPLIFRMLYTRKRVPPADTIEPNLTKFSLVGFFTGFVTALSGLGGGVIMVPVFTDVLKVHIKKATSISAGVVSLIAFAVVVKYLFSTPVNSVPVPHIGFITYTIAIPIIVGTLLSVGFGVTVSHKASSTVVKTIFALFSLLIMTKIIIETYF